MIVLRASARVVLAGVNTFLKDFAVPSVMDESRHIAGNLFVSHQATLTCNSWDVFVVKGMTRETRHNLFYDRSKKGTALVVKISLYINTTWNLRSKFCTDFVLMLFIPFHFVPFDSALFAIWCNNLFKRNQLMGDSLSPHSKLSRCIGLIWR